MFQKNIKITAQHGLHIRPAAKFVKYAQQFISDINITVNGQSANGKSLFQLQTLDLSKNNILTISATGEDEKQAVEYLIQKLEKLK
ncbi:HPr family phosphocarrier protein [Buchnera aphidicola (Takecallis taiwana)]|uniref:HPr family phosphocarrier protein n=1 Tax=Buchnera aphidicola TaxID=9 RepID=UPI0031B70F24